ncbi:MAG: hypothetical protein LQ338_008095, partial [Usnochroma carphineum]
YSSETQIPNFHTTASKTQAFSPPNHRVHHSNHPNNMHPNYLYLVASLAFLYSAPSLAAPAATSAAAVAAATDQPVPTADPQPTLASTQPSEPTVAVNSGPVASTPPEQTAAVGTLRRRQASSGAPPPSQPSGQTIAVNSDPIASTGPEQQQPPGL